MKYISLRSLSLLCAAILSTPFLRAMPPMLEVKEAKSEERAASVKKSGVKESETTTIPGFQNSPFGDEEVSYGDDSDENTSDEEVSYGDDSDENTSYEDIWDWPHRSSMLERLFPTEIEIFNTNYLPHINTLENSRRRIDSKPGDQEKFEQMVLGLRESLKRSRGNYSRTVEAGGNMEMPDVIDLVHAIARDWKITLPFNAPDLQDYSLQDLSRDLSDALTNKAEELEGEGGQEPSPNQNIIKYLQLQREAYEKGAALLSEISQERENQKIIDFFDRDFIYLDKSFYLYADALKAVQESRFDEAQSLATQALGYLSFTQEKIKPSPRGDILENYKRAFVLLEKSKAILARQSKAILGRGNDRKVTRFTLQAEILLSQNQEKLEDVRGNIIEACQKSLDLIKTAEKALGLLQLRDTIKYTYLINQSMALYHATHEAAAREPRADITQGYAESASFFEKAVIAKGEGQLDLAESLNGQGLVVLDLTREQAGLNRPEIMESYQANWKYFILAEQYRRSEAVNLSIIQCYNNLGKASLGYNQETARPGGPRENITTLYWDSVLHFNKSVRSLWEDNTEEASSQNKMGLEGLSHAEKEKKKSAENKEKKSPSCVIS